MLYNIRISDKSKLEEAKLYNKYLQDICNSNTTSIYIDGSQILQELGIGFGFAVYKHNTPVILVLPIYTEY